MMEAEGEALGEAHSLEAAAKLTRSERYKDVMGRVRAALEGGAQEGSEEGAWTGPSEESPTYRCLLASKLPRCLNKLALGRFLHRMPCNTPSGLSTSPSGSGPAAPWGAPDQIRQAGLDAWGPKADRAR